MPDPNRDKSVEEWLRQTPVAGARVDDCLDAETLAAWSEGVLDGRARASAEAHAADCARCQAMLAVMVRTTPAPAGATASPFRKWLMMLGPALAAAAAVALWVAVDRRQTSSVSSTLDELSKDQAKAERPAEVGSVAVPRAAEVEKEVRDAAKSTAEPSRELGDRAGARAPADTRLTAAAGNERAEKKDLASATRADKPIDAELRRAATPEPVGAPVSATPPPAAAPAAAESVRAAAPSSPVVVAPPGPAPQQQANQLPNQNQAQAPNQNQAAQRQQAAGALEERVTVAAERPLARAAGDNAAAGRSAGRGGAAGGLADAATLSYRAKVGNFDIVVAESSTRWRVVDGRIIQRSLDAGATWTNHHTAENDVTLTAGSAPSSNVCWLVGRSGGIVLTTDGRAWRRLKFSEPADLAAVTATDARTATVTTADGRLFGTTDGGRTWTRR